EGWENIVSLPRRAVVGDTVIGHADGPRSSRIVDRVVVATPTSHPITSWAAHDAIRPDPCTQRIVAGSAEEDVVTAASGDVVVPARKLDEERPRVGAHGAVSVRRRRQQSTMLPGADRATGDHERGIRCIADGYTFPEVRSTVVQNTAHHEDRRTSSR